jgi:LysR family transcriptional regulator, glycine cleavage system transcriptional activator
LDYLFVTLQVVIDGVGVGIGPLPVLQADLTTGGALPDDLRIPDRLCRPHSFDANKTSSLTAFID